MKTIKIIFALAIIIPVLSCNGQQEKKATTASPMASSDKIEAYYFHFTARCTTCKTIEAKAKEFLETDYPKGLRADLSHFSLLTLMKRPLNLLQRSLE